MTWMSYCGHMKLYQNRVFRVMAVWVECVIIWCHWKGAQAWRQMKVTWQLADTNGELLSISLMFLSMFSLVMVTACSSGKQTTSCQSHHTLARSRLSEQICWQRIIYPHFFREVHQRSTIQKCSAAQILLSWRSKWTDGGKQLRQVPRNMSVTDFTFTSKSQQCHLWRGYRWPLEDYAQPDFFLLRGEFQF